MKLKAVINVIALGIIGCLIHKLLFYFFVPATYEESFVYSIPVLYAFFMLMSVAILFILNKVREKKIDSVGYTFLLLTSIKMVIAYTFLRPILAITLPKTPTEKISFFFIFIYFLAIETILTIRILNNKQ